jgi:tripartite-type tricarboxylate transporter receptor subunit TctC
MRCLRSLCLVAFASLLLLTTGVRAGPYPTRSIRIVVPYAPGGNSDLIARILAVRMSESLGQSVVVENRPGASGIIGSEVVARAEPDGYTLLLISSGNLTTNPTLFTKLPYDTVRDFSPISNVAYTSYVLSVNPSLQVKSVKELIDLAKASPGSLDAAIPGIGAGGHLALELFTSMSGAEFTQVVYKGAGPAMTDTIAGTTKVIMDALPTSLENVRGGVIRALAQSGTQRSPLLPDVPTMAEAGLPGYEAMVYNALLGPAGLPRDIVLKLQAEVAKAGLTAVVRQRFAELGLTMTASTPEELADFIKVETVKWAKIIRETNMKIQ